MVETVSTSDNAALVVEPTMDSILKQMGLTHPADHALLMKLLPWIQQQRPKFMYTSILSLAVLLQRMARAFACRSTNPTTGTNNKPAVAKTNNNSANTAKSTTTTTPSASHHTKNATNSNGATPKTVVPAAATKPAPAVGTRRPSQQQQPSTQPGASSNSSRPKPRRKSFRSLKKLDLSPNVVSSLKGFVADLARTLPLIQDHAAKSRRKAESSRSQLKAVDIIDVCLELMEGEVVGYKAPPPPPPPPPSADGSPAANTNANSPARTAPPNAAMELFRLILDDGTSHKEPNAEPASTMDQHKFKTFCVKTLESAQSRTIEVVESYYDFKLLWNVASEQNSVRFVPTTESRMKQQEMTWKLAYYIIWKRQEEQPQLCSRRERIMAVASSMLVLSVLPLAYRPENNATTNNNNNNKRPLEETTTTTNGTTPAKMQKTSSEGGVHAGGATPPTPDKESHDRWKKRQDTQQIIVDAAGQASSFLWWAGQSTTSGGGPGFAVTAAPGNTEIKPKELELEIFRVVKDLAAFANVSATASSTNNWLNLLKSAIGTQTTTPTGGATTREAAEEGLKKLVVLAFAEMQRDEETRRGTRVEAVSYIEEFTMMDQESIVRFVNNLCKVTGARQKEKNELIACIPMTVLPPEMSDSKAEIRRKSVAGSTMTEYQAKPSNPRTLVMEESHSTFVSHNRAVDPPVVTEPMELNEWTIALLASLAQIQPSENLRSILNQACVGGANGEDPSSRWASVIIPLLTRFLSRMQQTVAGGAPGPLPVTVTPDGALNTSERTQDTQLWASVIQLYYFALEAIFTAERKAINATVVLSAPFHEAVLACSYLCAVRAVSITGKMKLLRLENHQIYTILPITGSTPYSYLKVTESFLRGMTVDDSMDGTSQKPVNGLGSLPRILQMEVKNSEGYVIESLLWIRDNRRPMAEGCIVNTIAELKQANCWPPDCLRPSLPEESEEAATMGSVQEKPNQPEYAFVTFVSRKLLKIAFYRIQTLCKGLSIPTEYPVASQVWLAFRFLLRHQVELLYGRHIDQWILCTIYGVCRVMKYEPAVTFARIIDVYVTLRTSELGEETCQAIVRHVKILDAAGEENGADPTYGSTKMGDIIRLYNLVFVPIMVSYLLKSKALKKDALALKEMMATSAPLDTNGQVPAAAPAAVKEGNVTVQLTVGSAPGNVKVTKDKQKGAEQPSQPQQQNVPGVRRSSDLNRTFLQFGKPTKNITLANEMVARAAGP
ncbi:Retinoblastoma-associated protein [Seminavis robusta]|uniref:Retinoblastoma-associated protein n=1 Tax=Seminavis robusta TaxID=568900 RepID=A0A9N8EHN7_9STRA|nr:Retinoblastoma-associated protein [Seminavis robusta]|eukprot:Sro1116_g242890.1 Retinoblastoma-associated protein (1234) ;mRNA; f:18825-22711